MREGDTLVVPKLDRLVRSVPDARAIADLLRERGVKLALGRALYDPDDPMGKLKLNSSLSGLGSGTIRRSEEFQDQHIL